MKTINRICLLGNVSSEPEIKNFNGVNVAKLSLATSTGGYTKQDGTPVPEVTQFHRLTAWRGLADTIAKYVHKGDGIYVEGRVEYSERPRQDGTKDRYTDIQVEELSIVRSKTFQQGQGMAQGVQPQYQPQQQYAPQPQYAQQQPMAQGYAQPANYGQQYPLGAPQGAPQVPFSQAVFQNPQSAPNPAPLTVDNAPF